MTAENRAFSGYVSHPSLGDEVVWGSLVFEGWRLRFESETLTREIPLVRVRIEREDSEAGGIVFSDPQDPEWSVHTLEE